LLKENFVTIQNSFEAAHFLFLFEHIQKKKASAFVH